ncbi:MAG: hypothetical protein ACR2PZ_25230, partial [Pseudomonadales bacterium]
MNHAHISILVIASGAWSSAVVHAAELDEIVVTAQKREQNLQQVPLAVSAFSGEFLESLQLFYTDDLSQVTPTITVLGAATSQNKVLR